MLFYNARVPIASFPLTKTHHHKQYLGFQARDTEADTVSASPPASSVQELPGDGGSRSAHPEQAGFKSPLYFTFQVLDTLLTALKKTPPPPGRPGPEAADSLSK